jgi:hypothetical protein
MSSSEEESDEDQAVHYAVEGDTSVLSREARADANLLEAVMEGTEDGEDVPCEEEAGHQSVASGGDGDERLENIQQAKSLIVLFEKEHDPKTKASDISYVWKYIKCMRLAHPNALDEMEVLEVLDPDAFEKWNKVDNDDSKYMYCCDICYNNPKITLFDCFKMGQRSGPGNTTVHVNKFHNIYSSSEDPIMLRPIRGTKRASPSEASAGSKKKKKKKARRRGGGGTGGWTGSVW